MRRRLLAAALAVLVASATASAAPPRVSPDPGDPCPGHSLRVWLVRRKGTAPREVKIGVRLGPKTDEAMIWAIATRRVGGRRVIVDGGARSTPIIDGMSNAWVTAYAHDMSPSTATPGPPVAPLCYAVTGLPPDPWPIIETRSAVDWDYYVVAWDDDGTPTVSPGWTATPVKGGAMHVITGERSGTGVKVSGNVVEHFSGSPDVRAGRWGSLAVGSIPCDVPLYTGVGSGVGRGVLEGGGPAPEGLGRRLDCDTTSTFTWGASNGPTTWRLRGDVTGYGVSPVRLAVFDLPKP